MASVEEHPKESFMHQHMIKPALALLGMLAVSGASVAAEAQLYGTLDLNLGSYQRSYVSNGGNLNPIQPDQRRLTEVAASGRSESHLGFRGHEDLGAGAKVMFQLEAALAGDVGRVDNDQFWGRNARVGVTSSDWGTLWLGRSRTVFFDTLTAFSPFGEAVYGPSVALLLANSPLQDLYTYRMELDGVSSANRVKARNAMINPSWSNSLTYTTPSMLDLEGVSAALQWGMKESDPNGFNLGLSVRYDGEDMDSGFAFQSIKSGLPASPSMRQDSWVAGAAYDATYARVYGQLGQAKVERGGETIRSNYQQVGVSAPISEMGTAQAAFGLLKNKPLQLTHRMFVLGYNHAFSKRTDVYADWIYEQVDLTSRSFDAGNSIGVGVRHRY